MISYRILIRLWWGLLLLLSSTHGVLAGCTAISTTGSFGSLTSFAAATQQKTSITNAFSCSPVLLTLLSSSSIKMTILSSSNNNQLVNQNNQAIPYNICPDEACGTQIKVGETIDYGALSLLQLLTSNTVNAPIYLQTLKGANVPQGVYRDTITMQWDYHVCYLAALIICLAYDGSVISVINVEMTVNNYCYIDNAPNVNFGTAAFPSAFTPVTGNSLSVRCTLGATYSVNLTSNNPLNGQYRQMASTANGITNYLQYQILKADTTVWTPTADLSTIGTGASQFLNYTATVNPNQPNVPSGNYTDSVTVTVTY